MAAIRWHPRAERVLEVIDDRQAARIERALDRVERFPLSGTPIEGIHPRLRRVLAGGGRTAWSIFYVYDADTDSVTVIALGPPGVPVLPHPD
jgi:mRNA-degrading endonuclease RelE of RelBE toxin-antitoxin system